MYLSLIAMHVSIVYFQTMLFKGYNLQAGSVKHLKWFTHFSSVVLTFQFEMSLENRNIVYVDRWSHVELFNSHPYYVARHIFLIPRHLGFLIFLMLSHNF